MDHMTTTQHRRTVRRPNTVARAILAVAVVAAAGAGLLSGSAGADDAGRPAGTTSPAGTAAHGR